MMGLMPDAFQLIDIVRVEDQRSRRATDRAAAEVPLEVRLNGQPFSVIMRTPGADQELAVGFLFSEGIVSRACEIEHIETNDPLNIVDVVLPASRASEIPKLLEQRRSVVMNASCGLCGRPTLESAGLDGRALAAGWAVTAEMVSRLPACLRQAQRAFAETGGIHAAGLFDLDANLETIAEDVGRHNAVDKVVGRMVQLGRLPLERSLLFVSGRSSFEIVQKAFLAGIPFVAAVSAPSSLAIELARTVGITLLGFVRDGNFNIYAHEERIELT
jgi:FdhD protein